MAETLTPLDGLAEAIEGELPSGVSIIVGPAPQLKPPALVLRPDNPWLIPSQYCADEQRYVAIAVVTASTPASGVRKMYAVIKALLPLLGNTDLPGWSWESVSAPVIDETTGTPLLAASVRLKFQNSED
jgi:hypothetical protein